MRAAALSVQHSPSSPVSDFCFGLGVLCALGILAVHSVAISSVGSAVIQADSRSTLAGVSVRAVTQLVSPSDPPPDGVKERDRRHQGCLL